MNKYIGSLFIAFLLSFPSWGQSTTITPGSILPSMTTAQRTAVLSPPDGMLIFDNTTQSYWFRQNGAWVELPKGGSTSNYWELNGAKGNEIKNTNSGGFWSANPVGLNGNANNLNTPPIAPVSGSGTRLMWIPARSAFRAGTIMGDNWDAENIGLFSSAMGYECKALENSSHAIGAFAEALKSHSTAIGFGSRTNGNYATAIGNNARANGYKSVAIGEIARSDGENSIAIGTEIYAKAYGGFTIGTYNNNDDSPDAEVPSLTDRVFQLGIGYQENPNFISKKNALTVLRNGNIGTLNTIDPKANLHLQYTSNLNWDAHLRLQYDADAYGNIVYDFDGFKFRTWGDGDDFYFRNKDNTTVARINDTGNMTISGTLTQNSDRRLKTNISQIQNSGSKLSQVNGYHYNWKATDREKGLQTGLIAQEVLQAFPELVNKDEEGYLSVNYIGLIPHLIEAQKELKTENEMLKERLLKIEEKLNLTTQTASIK